ncbi:hypothetical protein CsSME_00047578 [Camellia sinensis var. sinensis]
MHKWVGLFSHYFLNLNGQIYYAEQQEQLKFIYQKFKAEVNRHLEECKSTVEGLDTQEREFRGVVEKQKTSQRKLLKQLEEAVETQLSDAQRRITAVHNASFLLLESG